MAKRAEHLAIVGGGNMARAIVGGALRADLVDPGRIAVAEPEPERRAWFAERGVAVFDSAGPLAGWAREHGGPPGQASHVLLAVGSSTGRDGIHGASFASEELTHESEQRRPQVQVGDPFTEKLLIEACLELMATDAIVAIPDMGAAGLTSSSVEMASKGGAGG